MDIDQARSLGALRADAVNQVFLKVADMAETESAKRRIAGWMPRASVASPGTMLQMFGGVSQAIGRFGPLAVGVGAVALIALGIELLGQVPITLPGSLPGENPVDFADGGFHAVSSSVLLPAVGTVWDWAVPPFAAAIACGIWGWIWSRAAIDRGLWAAIKAN